MMKSIYQKILLSSLGFILFAVCFIYSNSSIAQTPLTTWQEQLEYAKNNSGRLNEGDASHLNLINYVYKGTIKSEIDKNKVISSLLSLDAPVVMHLPPIIRTDTIIMGDSCVMKEKSFPKFEIATIRELIEIAETTGEENPVILMKRQLGQLIQIGFEYLELEWQYKGKTFHSICIVSNKNEGVIYEPIGGNIAIGTNITIEKTTKY